MQERYRTFLIVWVGQLVSLVGSGLTWFGISIWVFLESGSVTQLAIVLLASQLPRILLSPIAGTFVDRWDRRWAMILSDAGAGLGTLVMVALHLTGNLTIPALAAIAAVSGAFQAFQWPAQQAATTLLVPKEKYSQASGMVQMAEAISNLVAPALGGIMVAAGGLGLLIAIDVITFVFAVGTLLFVRFPKPPVSEAGAESKGTVWHETKYGFTYIFDRKGLFGLLLYFTAINFAFGCIGCQSDHPPAGLPLADRVFVPLMNGDSSLGTWLQGIFGTGNTAAYGLFFALAGISVVVISGVAWFVGPVRNVERDIPDAHADPGADLTISGVASA